MQVKPPPEHAQAPACYPPRQADVGSVHAKKTKRSPNHCVSEDDQWTGVAVCRSVDQRSIRGSISSLPSPVVFTDGLAHPSLSLRQWQCNSGMIQSIKICPSIFLGTTVHKKAEWCRNQGIEVPKR